MVVTNLSEAMRITQRLSEAGPETETSLGVRLNKPPKQERQRTVTSRRLPSVGRRKVSPGSETVDTPSKAPMAHRPTISSPGSSTAIMKDAKAASEAIRKIKKSKTAQAWQKKLVSRPLDFKGTAAYASPEHFHQVAEKPTGVGNIGRGAGESPSEVSARRQKALSITTPGQPEFHTHVTPEGKHHVSLKKWGSIKKEQPEPRRRTDKPGSSRTQRAMKMTDRWADVGHA